MKALFSFYDCQAQALKSPSIRSDAFSTNDHAVALTKSAFIQSP